MRRTLPSLLLALVLALAMVCPLPLGADLLTAWPLGEADNHLWMHWQAAHPGPVWANVPDGTGRPLMDPVNLPWFALGFLVSPAVAWNLTWVANVALALAGGHALGREVSGRPEGGWVGMAVVGTSPYLAGVGAFGLTEAWPIGLWALHLVALRRYAGSGRVGWAVAASALLSSFALSGGYHALFAALAAPLAAGWAASVPGWRRRRWLGFLAVGACAGLALSPLAVDVWEAREVWSWRWSAASPVSVDPGWRVAAHGGADLLHGLAPRLDRAGRSLYLGLATLVLAGCALVRGRRAGVGWLAGAAVVLLAVSWGRTLRVAGHAWFPLPSDLIPLLHAVTHWERATGLVTVCLGGLAAAGAAALLSRSAHPRRLALVLVGVVVLDGLAFSGNPWPRTQYDPRPPAALRSIPGRGALVLLPFDNGRSEFGKGAPRLYDRWGPWLGRPLSESYEGPDALLVHNRLVAAADRASGALAPRGVPDGFSDPADLDAGIVAGARAALRAAGVDHLVLLEARAADPSACRHLLDQALGPPVLDRGGVVAWVP